ncbi:MAG: gliding motility-associated C-terminal domain-containing protein [Crocinitomicaceae bacterium]
MKIFLIQVALTLVNNGYSQLVWTQQNSTTTTQFIDNVDIVNANVGYVLMYPDKVLSTTNGGSTWTPTTIPGSSLNGICFIDTQTGWMIDYVNANIYKTTNGGGAWQLVYSNPSFTSYAYNIYFVDANHGWATRSDYFLHTTDGGISWDSIPSPGGASFQFVDQQRGFILYGNDLNRSSDGGATWNSSTIWTGPENINGFFAFDTANLWAVGENGLIRKSIDGGNTWSTNSISNYNELKDIHFFDANNGIAVGVGGLVISTADGGVNWSVNTSGVTTDLYQLDMISAGEAWVTGASGTIISSVADTDIIIENYDGNSSVCAGSSVIVELSVKNLGSSPITSGSFSLVGTGGSAINYNWSGLVSPGSAELINIGTLIINQSESFTVAFTGDANTANNSFSFPINVIGDPITFSGPHLVCETDSVTIYGSGGLYYTWTDFTTTGYDSSVTFIPTATAYYPVSVEDSYGCLTYDSIKVELDFTCGDTLIIDSLVINNANIAITPNGDNKNDYLFLDGIENTKNTVVIYNRWGDVIIQFENYNNSDVIWGGENKLGGIVPVGTYYFKVEVEGEQDQAGWVQILR